MTKAFILFSWLFFMLSSSFAQSYDLMDDDLYESFEKNLQTQNKRDFKRRLPPPNYSNFNLVLSVESNFRVPLVGRDNYFGRIYFMGNDVQIRYRDELIAETNYANESKSPNTFFYRTYSVSEINNPQGMNLIDSGAVVNLKSTNGKFLPSKGGNLILRVKHPFDGTFELNIGVSVINGKIQTAYVSTDGSRYYFDTLKINAAMMGIIAGIKNIEFYSSGHLVFTKKQ